MPVADGTKSITITVGAYEKLRSWSFHDPDRRPQQELASLAITEAVELRESLLTSEVRKMFRQQTNQKKGKNDAS